MNPITRGLAGMGVVLLLAAAATTGCASASSKAWTTPDDVLSGVTDAGFSCVLPTSDPLGQVLTIDPTTGEDLGGNSLVRCPDFQVMLAKESVEKGFATLVQCQAVPQDVRESAEWSAAVVTGPNFVILPADLSKGWATGAQPGDMIKAFGGSTTTFGELYDKACAGAVPSGSAAPSGSTPPLSSPVPLPSSAPSTSVAPSPSGS